MQHPQVLTQGVSTFFYDHRICLSSSIRPSLLLLRLAPADILRLKHVSKRGLHFARGRGSTSRERGERERERERERKRERREERETHL